MRSSKRATTTRRLDRHGERHAGHAWIIHNIAIATEPVPGHSIAFRDLAVTQGAIDNALIAAKALAPASTCSPDPAVLQRGSAEFRTSGSRPAA